MITFSSGGESGTEYRATKSQNSFRRKSQNKTL